MFLNSGKRSGMEALRTDKLSMNFGGLRALAEVSLSVDKGERRGIIGPNGAGKTTLFNVISGSLHHSSGDIHLFGQNVTRKPLHWRVALGIGRTFQKSNTFLNLTVMENISLALGQKQINLNAFKMREASIVLKAEELLEKFALYDKKDLLLKNLSYGEQRVMDILLALALEPKLLLLDEPTAGLAPAEVVIVSDIIKRLPQDITVVIIEHDMDVIFDITERITVLHYGRVLADGYKDDIRKNEQVREIYLGRSRAA